MLRTFLCLVVAVAVQSSPRVPIGSLAPGFSVADDRGREHSLSALRGKYVVLEWHEKGCPYVAKHYKPGQMQALQNRWMERGVVWLLVKSSTEGSHSYLTPDESRAYAAGLKAQPPMLLDTTGKLGKLYGTTTALHMVIIDPSGKVIYNGAIDDQPKTEPSSLVGAKNYVEAALTEAFANRPVSVPTSVPYGCEIHYGR
jgi:peroxiredoxin